MIQVVINGHLKIDNQTARVLAHLCSYDLHEYFYNKCSHEFKKDVLRQELNKIKDQLYPILEAEKAAIEAVNNRLCPKVKAIP